MQKICPRCGARSSEKKFIGNFCEDCFASRIAISIKSPISTPFCRNCGRIRTDKWEYPTQKALEKLVHKAIEGRFDSLRVIPPELGEGLGQAIFLVRAGSDFVEVPRSFAMAHQKILCEDCSRAAAGYFEAVIQVRCATPEKAKKYAEKLIKSLKEKTFIPKIVDSKHGIDIYVGSNKAALELLESLGVKLERSETLHGVRDGQRIYRTTYCVRG